MKFKTIIGSIILATSLSAIAEEAVEETKNDLEKLDGIHTVLRDRCLDATNQMQLGGSVEKAAAYTLCMTHMYGKLAEGLVRRIEMVEEFKKGTTVL